MVENGIGTKFQELNRRMQDLFIQWQPFEHATFEKRYIDPFDIGYMRVFQQGITDSHGSGLVEKITSNLSILEKIAAELFRQISHQAKGTPLDIKVNPYTISLTEEVDTNSDKALPRDPAIQQDVETMWFYEKALA